MKPHKKHLKRDDKGFYKDGMGNILDHRQIFGIIVYNARIDKRLTETQLAVKAKLSRKIVDLIEEGSFQLELKTWQEAKRLLTKALKLEENET